MSTPTFFVTLIVCFASIALAENFKTINGKEYKNVEVGRVEPDGLVLWSKSGISKVYFSELPKEVVDKWLPPEEKERVAAEKAAEEKRIQDQTDAAQKYWFEADLAVHYNDPNRDTVRQSYTQARTAADRAEAEYQKVRESRDFYYSGAFYFGLLSNPIQTAETDADGKFAI